MLYYLLMICLTFSANYVFGEEKTQDFVLPVKFYVPENYAVVLKDNEGEFLIAPKELDLEANKNFFNFSQPLISGVKLQFRKSFKEDIQEILSQTKKHFPNGFATKSFQWGKYPLVAIKMYIGMDIVYLAYVGFEDEDKNGLALNLRYFLEKDFGNGNKPSKEDLTFWESFLKKTQPIDE
ncbi:Uncharacterized protein PHSC3_000418 [Chlamydiales bacterium STE3]|nr:Uncharacterized protein PHSC3_000418 [Chlamydiales bacterium STE3]